MNDEVKVNNPIDTDPDPSPNPGATKLRRYWTKGPGAAKIRWGSSGDYLRCVRHLAKYVTDPKGLCNVYHRAAVGAPPGKGHGGSKSMDEGVELKKDYSSDEREALGKRGQAFKNSNGEWSYPIADESDLRNAIQAFGRSNPKDRSRLKAYIERRARALGKGDLIPDNWAKKALEADIKLNEVLLYAQTLVELSREDLITFVDDEEE
jgi:hypothetical protein